MSDKIKEAIGVFLALALLALIQIYAEQEYYYYYRKCYVHNGSWDDSNGDSISFVNGPGFNNATVDGDFTPGEAGFAIFFGPITKEAHAFSKFRPTGEKTILKLYKPVSNGGDPGLKEPG